MLAPALFVAGLVAITAGVCGLAGPWWALLAAGAQLVALAVLTNAGGATSSDDDGDAQ